MAHGTQFSDDQDILVAERLAEVSDLYRTYMALGALGRVAETGTVTGDPVIDTHRHPVGLVIRSTIAGF